ncbi:MAG: ABC transporter substrate-binding protein [Lachnospiraceae bacterium]|nr:ABC transporter substrate-binding protein [Lachnospiraceae bacterium]
MRKNVLKKLLALATASVLAFSAVACSSGNTGSSQATSAASEAAPAASTTAEAQTQESAGGEATQEAAPAEDIVTLKWVAVGGGMPSNYDAWKEQINAYLAEKIGVNIEMEIVSWGDWGPRRNVIVSTGGDYDILFTNLDTFWSDVNMGAFTDLTDIVESAAPELYSMIPEAYWDACRINGQIYAVPTYKDSSQSEFFIWDEQLAADNEIDPSQYTEMADLTPAFEKLSAALEGDTVFPLFSSGATWISYTYDQMNTGLNAIGVKYNDPDAKVVAVYEQEDMMEILKLFHEWYNAGYINSDAATAPEENAYKPFGVAQGWAGAAKTTWGPQMGVDVVAYQWGPTVVSNDTVRGSMNCISSSCAHPEKALQFLELVNTDSYVRDLLYYGVEGDNWEYTADGKVHKNNSDWSMAGYTQGTFFNVTPTDDVEFNQWDEVRELNEKAEPSVLLGFTFDPTNVADQIANCSSIMEQYKGELLTGTVDPEVAVPQMMEEMRAAGFDDIVAEAQAQVDAFMAAQ